MTPQMPSSPNPTYLKQLRAEKLRKAIKEGRWPPEDHPWVELLKLPPQDVEAWFQHPTGQALLEGLKRLKRLEVDRFLSRSDVSADWIKGFTSIMDVLLDLPQQVVLYKEALSQEPIHEVPMAERGK